MKLFREALWFSVLLFLLFTGIDYLRNKVLNAEYFFDLFAKTALSALFYALLLLVFRKYTTRYRQQKPGQ